MADMKLFLELMARSTGLKRELSESSSAVSRFSQGAKREFQSLRGAMQSVHGQLAALGLTVGVVQQLTASARLDKGLIQVKQTAGESIGLVKGLRSEFFEMARQTGRDVDGMKQGFDSLIQSGQSWKAALESTKGINIANAVTGANEKTLAGGLTVGATAFNIDLEKPGQALILLDKMTVAGRLGNAELENLSDIFARVGVNAASANMGFEKTLGFIEALSLVERQPERLATLADSTLRVFTNLRYMAMAQEGTGVKFFADDGSRRDPVAVLKDIKKRWDTLKNDKERAVFIQKAFGKADLDTIKGLRTLLQGESLNKVEAFTRQIGIAGGTLRKDLPEAISNAVDQTGRLKAVLRKAADDFAQPINKALSEWIKFGLDTKQNGGLNLTGREVLGGGGLLAGGTFLAARYGNKAIGSLASRLLKKGGSTAIGVAEGKALQAAAGVTPVFVTNWPAGGIVPVGSPAGAAGKYLAPLAIYSLPAAVVAAPFISKMISDRQRENGLASDVISRSDVRNQVMGIGGYKPKNDIKIDINFDAQGRAFVRTNDLNSRADVNSMRRGNFFAALTSTEGY
jgi:TP901 family phage tail tape measure protein